MADQNASAVPADAIERIKPGARMSAAVAHGNMVYVSGQVAKNAGGQGVTEQTADVLAIIDGLLEEAGTDKSKILMANIWLSDIATFKDMNVAWDAWMSPGNPPARATVESEIAGDPYTVEISVIATR